MANNFRIVTLGDSVPWGQGLLEEEKYDILVALALRAKFPGNNVILEPRLAHSGAVIDAGKGNPAPGEVPVNRLTIIEQCDAFADSPETVDLVLMNGGINDVGVQVILDPLALIPSLSNRIKKACHDRMLKLLNKVSAKFTRSTCRIVVTGYYTILSEESDPLGAGRLLRMNKIAIPEVLEEDLGFLNPIVHRCKQFFAESEQQLKNAIADARDPRILFVSSGFTDDNAVFAGNALLWGLNGDLSPQDPVARDRIPECDLVYPNELDPAELFEREKCHRASAGHPNVNGAIQFKNQIMAALG